MKNWKHGLIMAVIAIITLTFAFTACSGGGGKSLNSATELKEYLDKQPANSPDKPIKVAMKVNDMMIKDIAEVIKNAGKYVSLDLSGSPLTEIPSWAFEKCKTLAGITIPNGVTGIGKSAFFETSLTNVTIPNSVTTIGEVAFAGTSLANVTIPKGVTWIDGDAFRDCTSLTSVTFQATIDSDYLGGNVNTRFGNFFRGPFDGDLEDKYLAGGIGTYTTTAPVGSDSVWAKQ